MSLQNDSVDPTERSSDLFDSSGVEQWLEKKMEFPTWTRECENLPNCKDVCLAAPSPPIPLALCRTGTQTVPSGAFIRVSAADRPSQTSWKPQRPLDEAVSCSPVTAEKNRKWECG